MLWELFLVFLLIGSVSFGGGYSMIPVLEREVVINHGWLTLPQFTDAIAVAGMSPGPMATNAAIFIGYQLAGIPGAVVAAIGTVLPALLLILIVSVFFYKIQKLDFVKNGFYALRPIVTGLIFYAAFTFAAGNGLLPTTWGGFDWENVGLVAIFAGSLIALLRYKVHPIAVILISGLVGTAIYS
jgi:chromate transporter